MYKKLTGEQFESLYKQLPEELKEALSSVKTGDNILAVCEENGLGEEFPNLMDCASRVLLGILPVKNFEETLKNDLQIEEDTAKKISQEISRLIFYPVRPFLENIYEEENNKKRKPQSAILPDETAGQEKKMAEVKMAEVTPMETRSAKNDTYRESLE
jgi:hypothetical protein